MSKSRPTLVLLMLCTLALCATTAHADEYAESPPDDDRPYAARQQVIVIVEANRRDERLVPVDRRGNPRKTCSHVAQAKESRCRGCG